jgi:pimeloyl-ACP methyl ester carboxylesterase
VPDHGRLDDPVTQGVRVGFHEDWGTRAARWAGVRSEWVDLGGTRAHVLRADGAEQGPPQVLVHGLGGAATNWLEVLPDLARRGPVVAPDLPGFGRTRPPRSQASRVTTNARFLKALLDELGFERAVVHGNSMGGLLSVLLAELAPERLAGLVLTSPAMPSPRSRVHRTDPRTVARFAPFVLPGVGRLVLARMWAQMTPDQLYADTAGFVHGNPERLREELVEVAVENVAYGRDQEWRVRGFATAAESLVAMLVGGRRVWRAVDRLTVPTLLLWGDADALVGPAVIDGLRRRRPDWDHHTFTDVGHCPQLEAPRDYVSVAGAWTAELPVVVA